MKRIVLDTNVYIDWFQSGLHEPWITGGSGRYVRHGSSVVFMELAAGAATRRAQREIDALSRTFDRVSRLVHPSRDGWLHAGATLRRMRAAGFETKRASLVNDVLIALSVRAIGATLVTRDVTDHTAIRSVVGHSFTSVDG